ncbi:MAG TPA: ATP-dependent Clp protease proteolytic subunit, partial [Verrucomicrobiae bacterium]|nr:ATP-dependent Clp protease proteolytic subunit [Verrucomicrobiae bacterium]
MRVGWLFAVAFFWCAGLAQITAASEKTVFVIPVREEISTPLTYLVRRGVKQALEAKADLLILDMDTNGGRLDSTEEILHSLAQFKGETITFVNRKAFSAGAFIAVATHKIYMAPQSVIGAATPIMMGPAGGVEKLPDSVEAKMTSGVRALVRTSAEKNGYNVEVIEAMIDRSKELRIDGEVINEKGQILTLTNLQAEREFGTPPRRLLSSGTVGSIPELLQELGYGSSKIIRVEPTGAEQLAAWLTAIGPILLLAGIVGIYIEMKTPGFGIPGIAGIVSFALYFLGGYIAGLSGWEWTVVFVTGLSLFILELFVFPGTLVIGLVGGAMMLAALVMAMVDIYPGMPAIPTFGLLKDSLFEVLLTGCIALVIMIFASRYLLKSSLFNKLVDQGASGVASVARVLRDHATRIGETGVAISTLRPGGKAQFGERVLDVVT